jgi:serine/threonine-protein kinase
MRSELALVYSLNGMHEKALEECVKIDYPDRDVPILNWTIGYIMGAAGEKEQAREILNYLFEISDKQFVRPTSYAILYMALGETDKALDWLEKAYEQREGWLVTLKVEPMYDPLRSEPRFQAILEKMNFPE